MNDKSKVKEPMGVVGSCGNRLGRADRVEGSSIKHTRDSTGDGRHHDIPADWVERVDQHVHRNQDCGGAK